MEVHSTGVSCIIVVVLMMKGIVGVVMVVGAVAMLRRVGWGVVLLR